MLWLTILVVFGAAIHSTFSQGGQYYDDTGMWGNDDAEIPIGDWEDTWDDHEQRALLSFTADSVDTLKSSTVAEDIVRVLNIIWNKLFPEIEDVEWDQLTSMLNKDNVSVDSPQTSELKETVDMTTSTDSTLNKKSLRGMEVEESVVDNANGMLT